MDELHMLKEIIVYYSTLSRRIR